MKIASWNVNSVKARKDHLLKWLEDTQVDMLMIQELKGTDTFPDAEVEALGYQSFVNPQKTYNGVATILKKDLDAEKISDVLPDDSPDGQARFLDVKIGNTHYINIYLPNGNPYPGEKYDYKIGWMDRLYAYLKAYVDAETPFIIGGDFNVIPEGRDCYDPKAWEEDALFVLTTRQKFRALLNLGLTEAFRVFNQDAGQYTFWDYQAGAWPQNKGIRIDHFLLSPAISDKLIGCEIDKTPRGWDKPSDHTPIIVELKN